MTDSVVIAFLADVFVLDGRTAARACGLARRGGDRAAGVAGDPPLAAGHPRRHDLYRRFGFREPTAGALMERLDPESDRRLAEQRRPALLARQPAGMLPATRGSAAEAKSCGSL